MGLWAFSQVFLGDRKRQTIRWDGVLRNAARCGTREWKGGRMSRWLFSDGAVRLCRAGDTLVYSRL